MVCRFCGNENNDSSVNCFICGKPIQANIATSLVDLGDSNTGTYAINNQNDPYANRFASDTGGGPSIGPQSFSAQIMAGETTKKSSGTGGVIVALVIFAVLAAAAWLLVFRDGAPFSSILGAGSAVSSADAVENLTEDIAADSAAVINAVKNIIIR